MMEIRWSPEAADDLHNIAAYVAADNAAAASRIVQAIYYEADRLPAFPKRGRPGRVSGTRELVFAPLPYIAVYRLTDDAVEIVRVLHGAQPWP